jgi:hypothetical protein
MRQIGLQAEHLDLPIHDLDTGHGVELMSLPISDPLRQAVDAWDTSFQNGAFGAEFVMQGRALARRLRGELGPDWRVAYEDNRDVTLPRTADGSADDEWSPTP